MIKILFGAVLALLSSFCVFGQVQAASVGISPSEIATEVLIGQKNEVYFNISRSTADKETIFDVSEEGENNFLDLDGQEVFTLPVGEQVKKMVFYIDATELTLGEYETSLRFIMRSDQAAEGPGNKILYGMTGSVKFTVVEELTKPDIIDYEQAENKNELLLAKDFYTTFNGRTGELKIEWTAKNLADKPLEDIDYKLSVFRNDKVIYNQRTLSLNRFEANEVREVVERLDIGENMSTGNYKIQIFVGDQVLEKNVFYYSFFQGLTDLRTMVFAVAFLMVAIVLVIFSKLKKTGQKNRKKKSIRTE